MAKPCGQGERTEERQGLRSLPRPGAWQWQQRLEQDNVVAAAGAEE